MDARVDGQVELWVGTRKGRQRTNNRDVELWDGRKGAGMGEKIGSLRQSLQRPRVLERCSEDRKMEHAGK